ncbi:MAG: 3-deoxy-D-manno-octulosonic acid transferase [Synergistaceae bacterium]|jgi:3-deoxy-D-manno-octulosonic-acid transferase|nr:3-deoxy-D-manno-octulosonic acid transferase [Synergistaceae bacterium]
MKLMLYRTLTFLIKPLVRPLLALRRARGLETREPARLNERLGEPSAARPDGLVIWVDALSVGEGNSVLPIIDYILDEHPDSHVLVTTTTMAGAENMRRKLEGKRVILQFLPVDRRAYAERFLVYWRPSVGFFVDSNFWPNILLSAHARGVPLILLNGRLSDNSYARWMQNKKTASRLMRAFAFALAKSDMDAKKLSDIGISDVVCVGNMKYGAPPLTYDPEDLRTLASSVGGRKTWVASVTHEGEDELVLRAHSIVREAFPDALLILSPRHPNRGRDICEAAQKMGFKTALASEGDLADTEDVRVFDVLGGLGLFYAFSDVVFVGGSLLPALHGHNPMEPARLRTAVLSGRNVDSFLETYEILKRDDAVIMVDDGDDLGARVRELVSDPDLLAGYRDRAFETAERESAVLDRTKERLRPVLDGILAAKKSGAPE